MRYSLRSLMIGMTLLGVYLGLYSLLLEPVVVATWDARGVSIPVHREARFSCGGVAAELAFAPLVWIDQKVRSGFWKISDSNAR